MSRRFFIGVVPEGLDENAPLKVLIGKMKRTLRERDKEARWSPVNLWHVTLLFFGDLSDSDLDKAKTALGSWRPTQGLAEGARIEIGGVGAFPQPYEARVLWLGVQKTKELISFRNSLVEQMGSVGLKEADTREFVPHLTLARLRNLQSVDDLVRLGGRKAIGNYPVREVILFESVLQGNTKKYLPIVSRSFAPRDQL